MAVEGCRFPSPSLARRTLRLTSDQHEGLGSVFPRYRAISKYPDAPQDVYGEDDGEIGADIVWPEFFDLQSVPGGETTKIARRAVVIDRREAQVVGLIWHKRRQQP